MLVKEIKKKYPNYSLECFGKPLEIPTVPYTYLPTHKRIDDMAVIDYKVIEKPFDTFVFGFSNNNGKKMHYKGIIQVYVK